MFLTVHVFYDKNNHKNTIIMDLFLFPIFFAIFSRTSAYERKIIPTLASFGFIIYSAYFYCEVEDGTDAVFLTGIAGPGEQHWVIANPWIFNDRVDVHWLLRHCKGKYRNISSGKYTGMPNIHQVEGKYMLKPNCPHPCENSELYWT